MNRTRLLSFAAANPPAPRLRATPSAPAPALPAPRLPSIGQLFAPPPSAPASSSVVPASATTPTASVADALAPSGIGDHTSVARGARPLSYPQYTISSSNQGGGSSSNFSNGGAHNNYSNYSNNTLPLSQNRQNLQTNQRERNHRPRPMAWMSHGSCNDSLVDALVANRLVSPGSRVERAMRAVDRAHFCPVAPYVDAPQRLTANATISAPHMHAHALLLLAAHLRPGTVALDVGAGSGYLSAAMAELVVEQPGAMVVAVEHVPELADYAQQNINRGCSPQVRACVKVIAGDGRAGVPEYAPYGAIHIGAATPSIPEALVDQLARGGRMVCPVGPEGGDQFLTVIDKKTDDSIEVTRAFAVRYVPLCDIDHQLRMH